MRIRMRLLMPMFLLAASLGAAPGKPTVDDEATYRDLVKRVTDGDLSIDFRTLRLACLNAKHCEPRGESKDVASMRQALGRKQYEQAASIAGELIKKGFVNIEAHAVCAQAQEALNHPEKAKFHREVTDALIRSILKTGDGKTKETAFEVIGTFEEYIVMSVLGLPVLGSQSLMSGKPHSYDVQEREDAKTGQKVVVYFNIDAFFPMKGLR